MEKFFEARHADPGRTPGGAVARRPGRQAVPGVLRVRTPQHRRAADRRRDRDVRAVAGRRARSPGWTRKGEPAQRQADEKAPAVVWVWKTIADQFAGRITLFRVVSGTLKADSTVQNLTRDLPERFGHLFAMQGKTQTQRARVPRRRSRRRGQAQGHAHERRARRQGRGVLGAAHRLPRARARRTPSSRSRAATRTRSARRCSGCTRKIRRSATCAIRRPTNCCSPARASCTSKSPWRNSAGASAWKSR